VELPDLDWEFDTPENQGVDSTILQKMHEALADVEIFSVVTAKNGRIIDEYYKEGYDAESVFRLASYSKSFSGAPMGIAIDQGIIEGVEAKLASYFPQLEQSGSTYKQEITIRHLLTHSSGLEWYEWNGGTMFRQFTQSENWVDFVLERPMAAAPGTVFNYTTGGSHMLAAVLQQAAAKTAFEFAREHIFEPMGMDSVNWRTDPQGVTDGGNGISLNARDAAKFGQLYLDGGRWKDRQIIPQWWVEESVKTRFAPLGNSGSYGYQWWLRPFGEENYDTYYAMGHGGQFIFVVPEPKLVTVITGRFSNTYSPWPYFTDYVLAACTPQQETEERKIK
jgi:CubicO group peptidase (beta-lactamase class C family)